MKCALFLCQNDQHGLYKPNKFGLWKKHGTGVFPLNKGSQIKLIGAISILSLWVRFLSYHFISIKCFNDRAGKVSCDFIFSVYFFLDKKPEHITSFKNFKKKLCLATTWLTAKHLSKYPENFLCSLISSLISSNSLYKSSPSTSTILVLSIISLLDL